MKTILMILLLLGVAGTAFAEKWRKPIDEEPEEKPEKPAYVSREPSPEYLARKAQEEERVWLAKQYPTQISQQKGQMRRNIVHGLPLPEDGHSVQTTANGANMPPRPMGKELMLFQSSCGRR